MPSNRVIQRSFGGGEVSPEMYGRIDDAKYQTGAAKIKNFIVTPQGPVENRPGFAYVNEVKDSNKETRLIPFTYSNDQTMVVELGAGYFRFHTSGQTVLVGEQYLNSEFISDIDDWTDDSNIFASISWSGSYGGSMFFDYSRPFGRAIAKTSFAVTTELEYTFTFTFAIEPTDLVIRVGTAEDGFEYFELSDGDFNFDAGVYVARKTALLSAGDVHTKISVNQDNYLTSVTCLPASGGAYEVSNPYQEAELFEINHVQSGDVLTLVHQNHPPKELRRYGATDWALTDVDFDEPIEAPASVSVSAYHPTSAATNVDTYETMNYVVTTIHADGIGESSASVTASADNNIYVTGATNTITWSAVAGALRYHVYKEQGGIYGYIGYSDGLSLIDNNIAPDFSITPPIYNNDFVGAGNYPGAVSYFEQRRCFAGTANEPQKVWMTKSGTESNMSYGIPVRDDDRVEFKVAAREANTIYHLAPLNELIMLTGSSEWRVASNVTPQTIAVSPQSYVGSTRIQPVVVNNTMIYPAARGGHIRELGYSFQANGFVTSDITIRSAHLFDRKQIRAMAYAKAPIPIVWMVSTDGNLIGITYVPEQQIGSVHWHETQGSFESCCIVSEGVEDVLYSIVKREVNGESKRYIERMVPREFDTIKDCFFVDSGRTYDGQNKTSNTITISGGSSWGPDEELTLTSVDGIFAYPAETDIGDVIGFRCSSGETIRLTIIGTSSATVATAVVETIVPEELRDTAVTEWSFARNTISGLDHLEGLSVAILADGAVLNERVVSGGAITLERPACMVHVGLGYTSDLQTLPIQLQIDGMGQGRMKNINNVWARVYRSGSLFVGPREDALVESKIRTTESYGEPVDLKSEEMRVFVTPDWTDGGQMFIKQESPLPLTVVGLTIEVSIGG